MKNYYIAPSAAILVAAISLVGAAAGAFVSHVLWILTVIIGTTVVTKAVRPENASQLSGVEVRELPSALRERVYSAFTQLPEGDARRLLLGVVNQARLLFARGDSRFDASEEAQRRDDVAGLVDACCTTAADLARIDQFTTVSSTAPAMRSDLVSRAAKARELFRDRLTNAAAALAELYTANVERGTPSTDRVAELTAEISADASARSAATAEMSRLLDDR